MSFFDKTPTVVTQEYYDRYNHYNPGRFRCYLCGYEFEVDDSFRAIYVKEDFINDKGEVRGMINFLVCAFCDTGDNEHLVQEWKKRHEEFYSVKFWALR